MYVGRLLESKRQKANHSVQRPAFAVVGAVQATY